MDTASALILALFTFVVGLFVGRRYFAPPCDCAVPDFIECPFCSEPVRAGAAVCRTCHRKLSDKPVPKPEF